MTGIINTQAKMNDKLQMVGYVKGEIMTDCVIGNKGDILHAHEFHFSSAEEIAGQQIFNCVKMRNNISYQAGFYSENIAASYLHIHFAGCPQAAAKFLQCCKNYPGGNQ